MGSPSSSPSSQQSRPKPQLVAQQPQHLNIVNGPSGTNGQLSPRSSVFRTKSVIVFDFDHLEEKEPNKSNKNNKEEGTKLAKTKRKQKELKDKVQPMVSENGKVGRREGRVAFRGRDAHFRQNLIKPTEWRGDEHLATNGHWGFFGQKRHKNKTTMSKVSHGTTN